MHWFWLPNEMKACEASSLTLPLSTHYYSQHVWGADQEVFERQKRGGACFNFEGQKGDWRDIYTRETTDIWASGLPLWGKERKGADRYLSLEEKDMENNKNRDETNFDFLTFHRLFWTRTLRYRQSIFIKVYCVNMLWNLRICSCRLLSRRNFGSKYIYSVNWTNMTPSLKYYLQEFEWFGGKILFIIAGKLLF